MESLLSSKNNYNKYIAIYLLTNIIGIYDQKKFEELFKKFILIAQSEKTMTVGHVILNFGKIAKVKPQLRSQITDILIQIDTLYKGKHNDLIKAYAIEAFYEYFEEVNDRKKIIDFVIMQLQSHSPKTKNAAKKFLDYWNIKSYKKN